MQWWCNLLCHNSQLLFYMRFIKNRISNLQTTYNNTTECVTQKGLLINSIQQSIAVTTLQCVCWGHALKSVWRFFKSWLPGQVPGSRALQGVLHFIKVNLTIRPAWWCHIILELHMTDWKRIFGWIMLLCTLTLIQSCLHIYGALIDVLLSNCSYEMWKNLCDEMMMFVLLWSCYHTK